MLTNQFSIPVEVEVSLSDVLQGIFEIEGLLTYADEKLTIEYQPKELLTRSSRVETVVLSVDALREVIYKKKVVGASVTLLPRRLSSFEDVPLATNAQIVLSVKRSHRKEAAALVSHLQRVMSYKSTAGAVSPIPFRAADVGLRQIQGMMYLEDKEFLVFDVKNALFGSVDVQKQTIKVAPRALTEVRLDTRRYRDRLYIRPKQRNLLDAMPGSHKDELELKIPRKHREQVERLIYELTRLSSRVSAAADSPADELAGDDQAG